MHLHPMTGMILCGGSGKRLRPMTETIPKTLFEIKKGYTIMDRQLMQYKSAEFERVILLTAHLGEKIKEKFGTEYMGMKLEYVQEDKPMGTLNAIRMGMEAAGEDVMVSNGDVIADVNLKRMREDFEISGYQLSIFLVRMLSPYGIIEIGKNGGAKSYREKPRLDCFINAGFYCISKSALELLEKYKIGNIETTVLPELVAAGQVGCYREDGDPFWMSVDNTKDLEIVKKEYLNRVDRLWGYEKSIKRENGSLEKMIYVMADHSAPFGRGQGKTIDVLAGVGRVEIKNGLHEISQRFMRGAKIYIKTDESYIVNASRNTLLCEKQMESVCT